MGSEAALLARARRAYEWGRVRRALPHVLLVVPMSALSLVACRQYAATSVVSSLLALALLACLWRGQHLGRGARTGLAAGLAPLVMPLAVQATSHICSGGVCLLFPTTCVAGGVICGVAVWLIAARTAGAEVARGGFVLAALSVAALTGSLGCLMAGASGVLGMALGMTGGVTPLVWSAARRV